jgi:hypothetical protein
LSPAPRRIGPAELAQAVPARRRRRLRPVLNLSHPDLELLIWCCLIARHYWSDDSGKVKPYHEVGRLLPVLEAHRDALADGLEPVKGA